MSELTWKRHMFRFSLFGSGWVSFVLDLTVTQFNRDEFKKQGSLKQARNVCSWCHEKS